MRITVSRSGDDVTTVRGELDEEIAHCECLKLVSAHLLNARDEAQSQVTNLEMKLAEMEAGAAKNIVALEAKLAETEARAAESSIATERRFEDFCTRIAGDLAPLRVAYEHNIRSLGGICFPVPGTTPSTKDYDRWLKAEVDFLPQVFAGVNENFVSLAI
jgi:hypothetical protein